MSLRSCKIDGNNICYGKNFAEKIDLFHYTEKANESKIIKSNGLKPISPPDQDIYELMKMDWKFGELSKHPKDMSKKEFSNIFSEYKKNRTLIYATRREDLDEMMIDALNRGLKMDGIFIGINNKCSNFFDHRTLDTEFDWISSKRVPTSCLVKISNIKIGKMGEIKFL